MNATASTLPGYVAGTNPTLEICSNKNGNVQCAGSGGYPPPSDPEPSLYTLYSADVAYTFTPIFSSSNGILPLTLRTSVIHRQVAMRSMQ